MDWIHTLRTVAHVATAFDEVHGSSRWKRSGNGGLGFAGVIADDYGAVPGRDRGIFFRGPAEGGETGTEGLL